MDQGARRGRARALAVLREGREVLTALGAEYYATERCDYVLHVPVIRTVRCRDGVLRALPESTLEIEWPRAPHESRPNFMADLEAYITDLLPENFVRQSVEEIQVLYDRPFAQWVHTKKTVRSARRASTPRSTSP